jgi:hypothetical protein
VKLCASAKRVSRRLGAISPVASSNSNGHRPEIGS